MSVGNFSVFGAPERQYSDVESVQQPVQDNSKAVAAAGIGEAMSGIASLGNQGLNIYEGIQERERLAAKEKAKQLDITYSNRYDQAVRKYSSLYESGQITSQQANTYLGMVKDELLTMGASADLLSETESKVMKTLGGKALAEGTDQDQLEKATWKAFGESKWGRASKTPEETKVNFAKWQAEQAKQAADDAEMASLRLDAERYQKGTRERAKADLAVKDKQTKLANRLLENMPMDSNSAISELNDLYQSQSLDPNIGKAKAQVNYENGIKTYFNAIRQAVSQIDSKVEGGLPVQRQAAINMVDSYEKFALENVGDAKFVAKSKQLQEIATTRLALELAKDPNAQKLMAAIEIFGPNAVLAVSQYSQDAYASINRFNVEAITREPGDTTARLDINAEGTRAQVKALEADLKDYLAGNFNNDPDTLDKRVSLNLAYLSDNIGKLSTKESDELLKDFESPSFGEYVKQRKLTNADIENAKGAMRIQKDKMPDLFKGFISEMIAKESKKDTLSKGTPRDRVAAGKVTVPTKDDFELVFDSGQVVIKATNPTFRELASDWNKRVSAPLTRIIKVDANLSGASQKEIANAWLPALWEDTPSKEQPVTTVDYSQYEDGDYKDEAGNIFTIRNGVLTKGRGNTGG